jgi:RNA polymerase sigma-70 factor (ECF subfamily)
MTLMAEAYTEDGARAQAHIEGDVDAFAELYEQVYPDLVRFINHRVHNHALAEDLAQETIVRAYTKIGTYDRTRRLRPWLHKIAENVVKDDYHKRRAEILVDEIFPTAEPGADLADVSAERDTLVQSLAQIPLRQRRVLVLRYVEDRSRAELAAAFGLNFRALDQLLFRARKSLATAYGTDALTLRERASLALLPVLLRIRRLAVAVDAKVSAVAQAAMPIAANVAVGSAVLIGGALLARPAGAAPTRVEALSPVDVADMREVPHAGAVRVAVMAAPARHAAPAAAVPVAAALTTPSAAPPTAAPDVRPPNQPPAAEADRPAPVATAATPAPDPAEPSDDADAITFGTEPGTVPGDPQATMDPPDGAHDANHNVSVTVMTPIGPVGPTASGETYVDPTCNHLITICPP